MKEGLSGPLVEWLFFIGETVCFGAGLTDIVAGTGNFVAGILFLFRDYCFVEEIAGLIGFVAGTGNFAAGIFVLLRDSFLAAETQGFVAGLENSLFIGVLLPKLTFIMQKQDRFPHRDTGPFSTYSNFHKCKESIVCVGCSL